MKLYGIYRKKTYLGSPVLNPKYHFQQSFMGLPHNKQAERHYELHIVEAELGIMKLHYGKN